MAGTRALFASIGASVALVAAAALALLAVSVVFAFGGWSQSPAASLRKADLIFAAPTPSADGDANAQIAQAPIVAATPVPRPRRRAVSGPADASRRNVSAAGDPATRQPAEPTPTPGLNTAVTRPAPPPPPPAVAAPSGDGVRQVGDGLSSTVQNTGNALAQATAPLLPPISQAVQEVFNAVAALLAQTTRGLGAAVDQLLPKK